MGVQKERKSTFLTAFEQREKEARNRNVIFIYLYKPNHRRIQDFFWAGAQARVHPDMQ